MSTFTPLFANSSGKMNIQYTNDGLHLLGPGLCHVARSYKTLCRRVSICLNFLNKTGNEYYEICFRFFIFISSEYQDSGQRLFFPSLPKATR